MTNKTCCVSIKLFYDERLNYLNQLFIENKKDEWILWREETRQGADRIINRGDDARNEDGDPMNGEADAGDGYPQAVKRKKMGREIDEIYNDLKSTYDPSRRTTVMPDDDKGDLNTKEDVIKQLIYFMKDVSILKQKVLYNFMLIGRNFKDLNAKYKVTNAELDDIMKNNFKDNINPLKGYSRPMRCRYIQFHELSLMFNKIMLCYPNSPSEILNNVSKLEVKMEHDTEFDWK